jgi:hypothetical protein
VATKFFPPFISSEVVLKLYMVVDIDKCLKARFPFLVYPRENLAYVGTKMSERGSQGRAKKRED